MEDPSPLVRLTIKQSLGIMTYVVQERKCLWPFPPVFEVPPPTRSAMALSGSNWEEHDEQAAWDGIDDLG